MRKASTTYGEADFAETRIETQKVLVKYKYVTALRDMANPNIYGFWWLGLGQKLNVSTYVGFLFGQTFS